MQLELTGEQLDLLDELVSERITGLGTEIRHTDNRDYRQALVQKRESLRGLSTQLRDVSNV
ncbi:MAG: hypothetical protein ACOYBY_08715 [Dermatophilaceae bacterium]